MNRQTPSRFQIHPGGHTEFDGRQPEQRERHHQENRRGRQPQCLLEPGFSDETSRQPADNKRTHKNHCRRLEPTGPQTRLKPETLKTFARTKKDSVELRSPYSSRPRFLQALRSFDRVVYLESIVRLGACHVHTNTFVSNCVILYVAP